ncbi:hypothetical protein [Constantimarinum furrinae]|uniref:Membrane protein n=1 Tax=Constantimarinum furrinae TaxID=2562285 RepID=A0A7G8PVT0_9FLAO|nr:hypothetical protein [Constantimarinum furrinae]QNJ98446.1 Membrane protein [Constantimarinum furrinae]
MDELDILKKNWQAGEHEYPKLTYKDIYKMLLKKSSSIVKWIFLISIGELILWTGLAFLVPESSKVINEEIGLKTTFLILNIINYVIFGIFIVLFYKNYKKIQVTDSIKTLLENILRTRKTVKYFVIYNVGTAIILLIAVNLYYYTKQDQLYSIMTEAYSAYATIPPETFTSVFFMGQLIGGVIMVGILLIFYRLVYGILLKRLKKNYKELKKIEV